LGFLYGEGRNIEGQSSVSLCLPVAISKRPRAKMPLIGTMVRRSSCLNLEAKDGFQVVKIKEPTPKRRRRTTVRIDLDNPPQDVNEVINPIPFSTLQEWGVKSGVSPEELSKDALMQG
jgi:hypothetical protein